jgi:hypothetical protein
MKIKQYLNGNMEWKLDIEDKEDDRSWAGDHFYWLAIPRAEIQKAPQTIQNPGFN